MKIINLLNRQPPAAAPATGELELRSHDPAYLRLRLTHLDDTEATYQAERRPLAERVDQLQADLVNPDQAIVASAKESITNDLKMTVEDFNVLMVVRAKSANLEAAQQPTAEEWDKTYALLTAASKKKHRYPDWLAQETQPDLSVYWKVLKARLPRWRASHEARQAWQQALTMRSQPPLIDPDLLRPNDLVKTEITEPPYSFWKARTVWVKDRLTKLRTLRETAATPLAGLDTMLTDEDTLEMPVVGLRVSDLLALAEQREQGAEQLGLDHLHQRQRRALYARSLARPGPRRSCRRQREDRSDRRCNRAGDSR